MNVSRMWVVFVIALLFLSTCVAARYVSGGSFSLVEFFKGLVGS